eukprot:11508566-Alexandrium_andersonii.AAC.1
MGRRQWTSSRLTGSCAARSGRVGTCSSWAPPGLRQPKSRRCKSGSEGRRTKGAMSEWLGHEIRAGCSRLRMETSESPRTG